MSAPDQSPSQSAPVPAPEQPGQFQQAPVRPPQQYPVPMPPPGWGQPQPPVLAAPPAKGGFRRGFGAGAGAGIGLGAVLAVGMVVSSLVFGMLAGAAALNSGTASSLETVWGSPTAGNSIRAIRVTGTILADPGDGSTLTGGTYGYEVAAQIDALGADDAAGLLLLINTPGGSINGSKAMADAIERYQERTGKKVVAHVQGMSASGGMYTMAGADEIIADYGSLVGSIGVIFGPFERYKDVKATTGTLFTEGYVTTGGIDYEYLTKGTDKDFGNPFREMRPEERANLQAGLQNVYSDFVAWVAEGRGIEPEVITGSLGAHIFDPETAIQNGLIDSQLGVDDAYRRAATVMGVDPDDTRVVTPAAPSVFEQLLGAEARVPGHSPALKSGELPSAAICGSTPRALVFHGKPGSVCG